MADQQRLISHFSNRSNDNQSSGWSDLWDTDQSGLWDRGKPSPALIDWLESHPDVLPTPSPSHRLRALVPGCGKGYDVVMLALRGFDVYGLEVSQKGCETAEAYALSELGEQSENKFGGPDSQTLQTVGTVKIIVGDFFKREWEQECGPAGGFDMIYDYTFLCALAPEMRKYWACRMSELLAPTGVLVCLEFPLFKDLGSPGPPWGLKGVYWDLLAEGGDGIIHEKAETTSKEEGRLERVVYIKPPRSYPNGKGTDMLSVWKLKGTSG